MLGKRFAAPPCGQPLVPTKRSAIATRAQKPQKSLDERILSGEFGDKGSTKERMSRPLRKFLASDPTGLGGCAACCVAHPQSVCLCVITQEQEGCLVSFLPSMRKPATRTHASTQSNSNLVIARIIRSIYKSMEVPLLHCSLCFS